MDIEQLILYVAAFIFGSVFGSFACCQAWRIHERSEGKKLGSRSICMHCGEKLKWFDNLPIISWLILRGKCRNCHEKIGKSEILSELTMGIIFLLIAMKFGLTFQAGLLLLALIPYWILLIYDAKWGELPVVLMLLEIPIAIGYQFLIGGNWLYIAVGTGLLSGIYYLLYFFSKEKLVGGGDWLLCASIAIFLGRWEFAIIELFLSNLTASIAAAPQALKKDKKQIPFGPFLILALYAILLISDHLLKFLVIY